MNTIAQLKHLTPLTWILFAGYVSLLFFFNVIDVYDHYFFSTGFIVITYNLIRLAFIFYLMWFFYLIGDFILTYLVGKTYSGTLTVESMLLAFFAGVGFLHIILFMAGLAGLYTRSIMAIATLLVFALSLPRLDTWIRHARLQKYNVYYPGWLVLILPLIIFLMTKGLYPAGGHDYYNHYFQFYKKVVESGSIFPNEVWYQFYYSKGAALFFLSMLLTDPLAPQLASTAMIFAGAAIVFSILNKTASWRLLPWIGAALYITFLIYTPGPLENLRQGGWGDLEKPHEPTAVLMLAIIWLSINLIKAEQCKKWGITLLLTVSALVFITPTTSVFAGAYLSMITIYLIARKKKSAAWWLAGGVFIAGATLIFIWMINYLLTGMPDDQTLLYLWPIIQFDKIKNWGILFELILAHWAKTGQVASQVPLTIDAIPKIMTYLRLDVWWQLLSLTLLLFALSWCSQQRRQASLKILDKTSLAAFSTFILMMIFFSLLIGRDQPISFYRFTSFTYAPMLCFCLLLLFSLLRNWKSGTAAMMLLASLMYLTTPAKLSHFKKHEMVKKNIDSIIGQYQKSDVKIIIKNARLFMIGKYSIADAYQHQQGWPGRMPWGGIYPPAEIIWKLLPPHTRIWSMHVHSYCMLPRCRMEGYQSFRFSPHAEQIYYGSPEEAKAWLKKENLHYFFFSQVLPLTDPLPLSPLFSPEHIADYLGIAWTDGDNTLLTWKEEARSPIDSVWLKRYAAAVQASGFKTYFPYSATQIVFNNMRTQNKIVQASIPWYRAGWH